MARLWATGFELQTTTVGMEWATGTTGSPAIDTSVFRSGLAALRINNTGAAENIVHLFRSAQGAAWIRIYFRITSAPSSDRAFVSIFNSSANKIAVRMRSGANARILQLYNEEDNAQIGSDSSALSVDTWYRLEIGIDDTTLSATTAEARLYAASDEGTLAWNPSGTANLAASPNRFHIGIVSSDAAFDCVYDDIAINDSSGSYQNSWPGVGELIILRPNAAGDNAGWTRGGTDSGANWSQVEEMPPDDVTTYVTSNTANQIDDYNLDATPAAMESNDVISWVGVSGRFALSATTGGDPDFVYRLKAAASGTVDESGNVSGAGSTSYVSHQTASPLNYMALANDSNYEQPGTSSAWTKATLDTAQVGIRETVTDTHFVRVTALWVYVDHKPAPTGVVGPLIGGHLVKRGILAGRLVR